MMQSEEISLISSDIDRRTTRAGGTVGICFAQKLAWGNKVNKDFNPPMSSGVRTAHSQWARP